MEIINENIQNITYEAYKGSEKISKSLVSPNVNLVVVSKLPCSKKIIRFSLPHQISNMSICVLIKDLNLTNYEKTTSYWKRNWNLNLKKYGSLSAEIPSVAFISLRELKLEYQTYAAKRRLAATFDLFLADRRIVHHLPTKLGKAFYSEITGKHPIPTTLTKCNIVETVLKSANSVLFVVRGKGLTECVGVGNTSLSIEKLRENIKSVCKVIFDQWPNGGISNIRSIYIQISGKSLPLYLDETEASTSAVVQMFDTLPKSVRKNISNEISKLSKKQNNVDSAVKFQKQRSLANGISLSLLSKVAEDFPVSHHSALLNRFGKQVFKRKSLKS